MACKSCGGISVNTSKEAQITIDNKVILQNVDLKKIDLKNIENKPNLTPKVSFEKPVIATNELDRIL